MHEDTFLNYFILAIFAVIMVTCGIIFSSVDADVQGWIVDCRGDLVLTVKGDFDYDDDKIFVECRGDEEGQNLLLRNKALNNGKRWEVLK